MFRFTDYIGKNKLLSIFFYRKMADIEKKPDQQKLIGNWNAAATYSPGPSAAKYAGRTRVPCGHLPRRGKVF